MNIWEKTISCVLMMYMDGHNPVFLAPHVALVAECRNYLHLRREVKNPPLRKANM